MAPNVLNAPTPARTVKMVALVNYLMLGKELLENGCPEGALQAFDESIRRRQYLAEAHLYRGRAYLAMGAYVHAQNDLDEARKQDPRLEGLCTFYSEIIAREVSGRIHPMGRVGRVFSRIMGA